MTFSLRHVMSIIKSLFSPHRSEYEEDIHQLEERKRKMREKSDDLARRVRALEFETYGEDRSISEGNTR